MAARRGQRTAPQPEPEPAEAAPAAETAVQAAPDTETAVNVRTGATVTTTVPSGQDAYVAALLRERAGYLAYGRRERAADVDAELKRLGIKPDA